MSGRVMPPALWRVHMDDGVTKRIVVIRNLPSNIIEEAILILKSDPVPKDHSDMKKNGSEKAGSDSSFLLKEAYMVINDYIKENNIRHAAKHEHKPVTLIKSKKFMTNTVINAALIGSLALFIFMLSRFF